MLGLTHEIAGHHFGISRLVGNDCDFRGPGKDVDADLAEKDAFGFGHELVARPDHHIGLFAGEQAVGHGGDGHATPPRVMITSAPAALKA